MKDSGIAYYSAEKDPVYLTHEDVSEAIEEAVDQWDRAPTMDDTIQVTSYRRMELPSRERIAELVLDGVIERLDEDYGDPEGLMETIDEAKLRPAALAFADVILKNYKPWTCEPVKTWTERVADHVPAEWLKEPPQ